MRLTGEARPPEPDSEVVRLPVARVVVDLPLPHLDRPFDYAVPPALDAQAVPGARVRVRFAGQAVGGFVVERAAASDHPGRLAPLAAVVSPEPVLTPEVLALARAVADRYAGTLADVLRLAVPPRHAGAERAANERAAKEAAAADAAAVDAGPAVDAVPAVDAGPWTSYPAGAGLLEALRTGDRPRAVWAARPGEDWPAALAVGAGATLEGGRGALIVVPDHRDVARVDAALTSRLGRGRHVTLTADQGPQARYRRWLSVLRGEVRVVVGTRAAMFAPVRDLGLVAVWDDGDDLHAEPRAPYPHVREVLVLRAHQQGAAMLLGGFAVTAEGAALVESGWARGLAAPRDAVRAAAPRMVVAGADEELARDPAAAAARLPSLAWRTARDALSRGPVLVQVPRRGYVPALACQQCREPARCTACHGPLELPRGEGAARCRWCGRPDAAWTCPECGGRRLRAVVTGAGRTAEELGRAFPSVPVRTSGRDEVLDRVGPEPALVVATPGAEPVADGGYAAALLLDGWALLGRADLRAGEEALRRWLTAAALVRAAADGGVVVLLADPAAPAVQALVRWDPAGFAGRELAERSTLALPPAARMAEVSGASPDVAGLLGLLHLPTGADVLGPLPAPPPRRGGGSGAAHGDGEGADRVRALVRVPRAAAAELAAALRAGAGVRSARKEGGPVRVRIDPVDLG